MKGAGILTLAIAVAAFQSAYPQDIRIARYMGDRQAAVSYTFDDALQEHYTVLYPELRKRDIKATFWVNANTVDMTDHGEKPRMTWEQMREMAMAGQEISNHGFSHSNLTKLYGEQLRYEIQHNDTLIFGHVGVFPRTFCYPGNAMDDRTVAYASQGRTGTRTSQVDIGSRRTLEWLNGWLDSLIADGEWGVGMTHGISYGYDAFRNPDILWRHLDYAFSRKGDVWIDTFNSIASYVAERDAVTIEVSGFENGYVVSPSIDLDHTIFRSMLSLAVPCGEKEYVVATQGGRALQVTRLQGRVSVDFDPWGGDIKIYTSFPERPPKDVNSQMHQAQMLTQLGISQPSLVAPEADPNRQPDILPMVEKPGRWKIPGRDERRRTSWGLWTNYDDGARSLFPGADSARIGAYTPIDLLRCNDGSTVTTADRWYSQRRDEILEAVQNELVGFLPSSDRWPDVFFSTSVTRGESGGRPYVQKDISGLVDISSYPEIGHAPRIQAYLRTPADASGPVPVMIVISSLYALDMYWNIMAERGWGVCIFEPGTLQPDSGEYMSDYFIGLLNKGGWRSPSDMGDLTAWSWGISRLVDLLSRTPEVRADAIGVTGHSRYGKAAFYAMAFDKRIAIAFPSDAGCLGTAMERRHFGEDLELIATNWAAGNLMRYLGPLNEGEYMPRKLENLTVDAHSVLALCAPRPVFINSGTISEWADPYGMFLTAGNANPVYELLGVPGLVCDVTVPEVDKAYISGTVGYRLHDGGHTDMPDWPAFFEFASRFIDF